MFTTNQQQFTKRVLFVGIPDMAYVCLDGLLQAGVNIVGVMGPKKTHGTYEPFKRFALSRNMNFIEWDDLKTPMFIDYIKSLDIDRNKPLVSIMLGSLGSASVSYKIDEALAKID